MEKLPAEFRVETSSRLGLFGSKESGGHGNPAIATTCSHALPSVSANTSNKDIRII